MSKTRIKSFSKSSWANVPDAPIWQLCERCLADLAERTRSKPAPKSDLLVEDQAAFARAAIAAARINQTTNQQTKGPAIGLTVTEKEHWKERIERRLNRRIESIWATEPNLKERIDKEGSGNCTARERMTSASKFRQLFKTKRRAACGPPAGSFP